MIRALVFDLDDTLYPEREFVLSGFKAVDEWLRAAKSIQGFYEAATTAHDGGIRGRTFNVALQKLNVLEDPDLLRQMVEIYRAHEPNINLFADAEVALAHFATASQLGLITDGYLDVQKRKVAALGIANRFQAIVYSDEFGREAWKPSSIPYLKAAKTLGCAPSECAYVGDNPAKDFVTARQLNWLTIRVRRPGGEHFAVRLANAQEADIEIKTLAELASALDQPTHNTFIS